MNLKPASRLSLQASASPKLRPPAPVGSGLWCGVHTPLSGYRRHDAPVWLAGGGGQAPAAVTARRAPIRRPGNAEVAAASTCAHLLCAAQQLVVKVCERVQDVGGRRCWHWTPAVRVE